MKNLADISEPQVLSNDKEINKFNFPSVYSDFSSRKAIPTIET